MINSTPSYTKKDRKFFPKFPPQEPTVKNSKPGKFESWSIFGIAFITNMVLAVLFHFVWNIGSTETLISTGNVFYFLNNRENLFYASNVLGPPLPNFLLVIFIPFLRAFQLSTFSGPILSCFFAAMSLVILNRILLNLKMPGKFRWVLLGLVQLYPSYLFTAAVGSVEAIYIFVILLILWGLLQIENNQMAFLICGFGIAFGFLVQYDIVIMIPAVALALMIVKWAQHDNWRAELEGWMLAVITPPLYGIGLWLLLNWILVGSPLFFLKDIYDPAIAPAVARNFGMSHPFFLGWGSLFEALRITLGHIWASNPTFLIGLLISIPFAFFYKKRQNLGALIIIGSIIAVMVIKISLGVLSPWFHLWAFIVPLGAILIGMVYQGLKPALRTAMMIAVVVVSITSITVNFNAMEGSINSPGEQRFRAMITGDADLEQALRLTDPYWAFQQDAPIVANALDVLLPHDTILIENAQAMSVVMLTADPNRFLLTHDRMTLSEYTSDEKPVDYILTLQPQRDQNTWESNPYPVKFPDDTRVELTEIWSSAETVMDWRVYRLTPYTTVSQAD